MSGYKFTNLNRVIIESRLVKDVEFTHAASGTAIAKSAIVVKDGFKQDAEAGFLNIVAFGKAAERVGSLKKGDWVIVDGRLAPDNYGERKGFQVFCNDLHQKEWPEDGQQQSAPQGQSYEQHQQQHQKPTPDDDIPF